MLVSPRIVLCFSFSSHSSLATFFLRNLCDHVSFLLLEFYQFSGLHSSHCSNKIIKRICRKKRKEEQLDFKSLSNVPHLARSLLYRSTVSLCHTALFYLKLTLKINLRCALALCFFPLYLLLSTFLKFP